ncbi:MAG: hypothetical protein GX654_07000 [Desulfatiglans sp.]|nr:hypothetical protein [Desulfatiglans sp.]
MTREKDIIKNEEGSVLIVALVILVLITIMGLTVTRNADIDIQIAKNEREYVQEFYTADSAWREAIQWLDARASAPSHANKDLYALGDEDHSEYYNVRNYGNGPEGTYNLSFDQNQDGTLGSLDYWYKVATIPEIEPSKVAGFRDTFKTFSYVISGVAEGAQRVEVTVTKVLKEGY